MGQRRLCVVQLLPALEAGGVERGVLEVAHALVEQGHRAVVISAGGRLVPKLQALGAEHIEWPIGRKSLLTFRYVYTLRDWLRQNNADILHARSRLPAWVAYLAWKGMDPATRPRFLTTVHGLYSVKKYSSVMVRGEQVIAVSDTVKRYIQAHYPEVEENRIRVIYRGVDPVAFPRGFTPTGAWLKSWYTQYPQLQGQQVLTLPGRLTRLKGHADFIELIRRLRAAGHEVYGLIVGGEDPRRRAYAEELRAAVDQAGLADRILFTGHRNDVREIYAVSDLVFSLSTQPESFGRTVLEALCLGVPVVGYDHGGVGEILARLFAQGRVPVGDADQLQRVVSEFLEQKPVVVAQNPYTLQSMLEQTLQLYQECSFAGGGVS